MAQKKIEFTLTVEEVAEKFGLETGLSKGYWE